MPAETSPHPDALAVAVVVPRNGLRIWQVRALQRAETAGAIRVDKVIASGSRRGAVRDFVLELLGALEAFMAAATGRTRWGGAPSKLRSWCHPGSQWRAIRASVVPDKGAAGADGKWDLIINAATPEQTARWLPLATRGVLEARIGESTDIDDLVRSVSERKPTIDVAVRLVTPRGAVEIARSVAGLRERAHPIASMEMLLARAATVLARGIEAVAADSGRPGVAAEPSSDGPPPASMSTLMRLVRLAVHDYTLSVWQLLRAERTIWFLAYRDSPQDFVANTGRFSAAGLRALMPPPGHSFADPCVFPHRGTDHVFFEYVSEPVGKGAIGWMQRLPSGQFTDPEVVLEREYHLSYPYVFEYDGAVFMIPETYYARRIELYRSADFPRRWERVAVLVDDVEAVDPTPLHDQGKWWLFAAVGEERSSTREELFIYHADSLFGPWSPHAANPVKSDVRSARSAGRFFRRNGRLIRPAQNCSERYGGSLVLCEVLELTPYTYRERVIDEINFGHAPAQSRLHTLSFSDRVEFVDATVTTRRSKPNWHRRAVQSLATVLSPG